MNRFAALAATALVAGTLLCVPATGQAATRYSIDSGTASVRNGPAGSVASGYTIGDLYGSSTSGPNVSGKESFDLIRKSSDGNWGYGYAHGSFGTWGGGHCGWVLMSNTTNTGQSVSASCPAIGHDAPDDDALSADNLFTPGTWVSGTGEGTVQAAVIVSCANPYVYGNYDPATGAFSNRYPVALPAGRGTTGHAGVTSGYSGFGTRYLTRDGNAWLIKDTQSPAGGTYTVPDWHFVRSECVKRF